jgi:cephalosporin-C deacetylase-like acetyl esterase
MAPNRFFPRLPDGLRVFQGVVLLLFFGRAIVAAGQSATPPSYLEFVRAQAAKLREGDRPPATLADWQRHRTALRRQLEEAWGGFPTKPCALDPRIVGTLERGDYRVEKIVFQTRPGVRMTANAYVPAKKGKLPAVLVVHGHWHGAKQDPVVQARSIGLAKLGFFVLAVDAFGAGERGVGKALGEYHGEMVAATLWPVGLPLSGLQVYENTRAVDYMLTRPEVDPKRLGVTGASGGGNQTMYAGAWDERLAAVVPVCSVGNYQAYLGAACCMCEVVPGALRFTEEWGLLGLAAPRALMVVNATQDAVQFSVAEAKKSLALAQPVFSLYGQPEQVRHAIFESPHAYNQAMREAMYGWMTRSLKADGDGRPIPEPQIKTEPPETLRCYPGDSRPEDFVTIPKFAAAEGRSLVRNRPAPATREQWRDQRQIMLQGLAESLFGGAPPPAPPKILLAASADGNQRKLAFQPEPGVHLTATRQAAAEGSTKLALVLDCEGAERAAASPVAAELRRGGWDVVTLDFRATGKLAQPHDRIGNAPDHNTAEWSLWLGRPLLGQWVIDTRRLLDALAADDGKLPAEVLAVGIGPAGLVAIGAAALDQRITQVATVGTLASYITDAPYRGQRLGIMVPAILRRAGDIPHMAALVAPRRLVLADSVAGDGNSLASESHNANFAFTRQAYSAEGAAKALCILSTAVSAESIPAEILKRANQRP